MIKPTVTFIGFGNMAQAIAGGLNQTDFDRIIAADPYPVEHFEGVAFNNNNADACRDSDLIILATKPGVITSVCQQIAPVLKPGCVVICIAAGISIAQLEHYLPKKQAVIRCMPNTPALIQQGATGLFSNRYVKDSQKLQAERLFKNLGLLNWVEHEHLIDVITALSGSGPAYAYLLIESMTQTAIELGLPPSMAAAFARQTCLGASMMAVIHQDEPITCLRQQVTSPGGTTDAAVTVLTKNGFTSLIKQAMIAALERAEQLAKQEV